MFRYIRSKINFRFWTPTFDDLRPIIGDLYGKPISIFIRKLGDQIRIDPLKWYNGHPGEHTIEWKCEPAGCVAWTENVYDQQFGVALADGKFWAECKTPAGEVLKTQVVKLVLYKDYENNY